MMVGKGIDTLKLYGILSLLLQAVEDTIHEEYQRKLSQDQERN